MPLRARLAWLSRVHRLRDLPSHRRIDRPLSRSRNQPPNRAHQTGGGNKGKGGGSSSNNSNNNSGGSSGESDGRSEGDALAKYSTDSRAARRVASTR